MLCSSSFVVWFLEHLDPVNVKIAELREALESVVAEQKYLKARDTRHRHSKFSPFVFQASFSLINDHPSNLLRCSVII